MDRKYSYQRINSEVKRASDCSGDKSEIMYNVYFFPKFRIHLLKREAAGQVSEGFSNARNLMAPVPP